MPIFPKKHYPAQDVLANLARIIRDGYPAVPELTPATAWEDGEKCPAGHPLVPEGCNLYTNDSADTVELPAVIISVDADSTRPHANSSHIHTVPAQVTFRMQRRLVERDEDFSRLRALLEAYLTGEVWNEDLQSRVKAEYRMSTGPDAEQALHVWHLTDIAVAAYRSTNDSEASMSFGFNLLCCAHGPEGDS